MSDSLKSLWDRIANFENCLYGDLKWMHPCFYSPAIPDPEIHFVSKLQTTISSQMCAKQKQKQGTKQKPLAWFCFSWNSTHWVHLGHGSNVLLSPVARIPRLETVSVYVRVYRDPQSPYTCAYTETVSVYVRVYRDPQSRYTRAYTEPRPFFFYYRYTN